MDKNIETNLDSEFKKYLQIIRPHLGQLLEQDVIDLCNAWITKLSECNEHEKPLRNKYVFGMCYQLARGTLEEPFLKPPPPNDLPPLHEASSCGSSFSEVEYLVIDTENGNTKAYNEKQNPSQIFTDDSGINVSKSKSKQILNIDMNCDFQNIPNQNNVYRNTCKSTIDNYNKAYVNDGFIECNECEDSYQFRANNLIMKLREIKNQNVLLHNEIMVLKQESRRGVDESIDNSISKNDNTTNTEYSFPDTFVSLKSKLQEVQRSRNNLIETVGNLQEKLDYFNEIKKHEIEELEAKHRLDIINLKTKIREEIKSDYDNKFNELKKQYEKLIIEIQSKTKEEVEEFYIGKQKIIADKDNLLQIKEAEISALKRQHEDLKSHQFSMFNKLLDGSNDSRNESAKTYELEKRLYKMERTKTKCAKVYEAKVASLQREKHLAECSLQLQLVKQRAQLLNEVTEENQVGLTTALDKLENKYKEIVANVQATAVQRRIQDQIALESLIQAVCGALPKGNSYVNPMNLNTDQFSRKSNRNRSKERNRSNDREFETLCNSHRVENVIVENKSYGDASVGTGYCLDSEKLHELFNKVHIPQRDLDNLPK